MYGPDNPAVEADGNKRVSKDFLLLVFIYYGLMLI